MKTVTVFSKAQHDLEIELADLEGLRLAYVLAVIPGVWNVTFMPVETFSDWSSK